MKYQPTPKALSTQYPKDDMSRMVQLRQVRHVAFFINSSEVPLHGSIVAATLSWKHRPLAQRHNLLESSPAQQPDSPNDERPDDDLVLVAVALEAHGRDILLGRVFAEVDALLEAEGLGAFGT
jgi:hypothetical protein